MNLIKQILTDAKKQKAIVVGAQNKHPKANTMNNIPTIEVDEVQTLFIDDKIFEYQLIQRAREAEIILSEILTTLYHAKGSRLSGTVDHLLTKLRFKQNHNTSKPKENNNVPKIQVIDIDQGKEMHSEEGKFEMDYDTLIEQATQAQIYLEHLLNGGCDENCECPSTEDDSSSDESETKDGKTWRRKAIRLHHSPSKRISLKGEAYNLEHMFCKHKKRKISSLEFSGRGHKHQYNMRDSIDGVEGTFVYKEV
ncbi:uncharacterized protein [Clytia hemisphaerica]|uniref:uncharacterized protein n=1 Tax=Clytia hemisphaerica TaxID=252671 RepID=UPI0034D6D1DE